MSGHNGVIAGLAVIAVIMVFASGWPADLKAHIQGVQSVNAPTLAVNAPPSTPSTYPGAPLTVITGQNIQAGA